jgi:5'-nucleotidase
VVILIAGCNDKPASTAKTLVILHTTDEHSHVLGFGPELDDYPAPTAAGTGTIIGGIGRRATLIAQERQRAKDMKADSILVSAGDNTMGTLIQAGMPADFQLMKALGYDATTLGNHEFDFGPAQLAKSLQAAQAGGGLTPTISTNLHFSSTDAADDPLAALYDDSGSDSSKLVHKTWTTTTANGLKIGFIGLVGVDAAKKATVKGPVTFSVPAGGTESDDPSKVLAQVYADLQPAVDAIRSKVDVVVALSHSGVDTADMTMGEDYQIAQNVSGIDVIVSGHTHLDVDVFTVKNNKTGKNVYIQQAGKFGETLGRMTVKVDKGVVTLDAPNTTLLKVDDKIVSDASLNANIDNAIKGVEANNLLPQTLSRLTGSQVADDPSKVGDLYFYSVGKTDFDVIGKADQKDTPLMDLWADAELVAVEQAIGAKTDVALVAQGALRADLNKGKTGNIAFADIFRAVPLGISVADGSLGYPLCRTLILGAELKAAFEVAAGYAYTSSDAGDFYIVGGGIKVEYDTSRPIFNSKGNPLDPNNGRVTKMTLATDHTKPNTFDKVIFDLSAGGFTGSATDTFTVTGNLYVVQFAYVAGVTLKDPATGSTMINGMPIAPKDTIVHRSDMSEIKDWDALAGYIRSQPSMAVPARYMTASHMVCTGPLCKVTLTEATDDRRGERSEPR